MPNQTNNLPLCYVSIPRVEEIEKIFNDYEEKRGLTSRDWYILLPVLERISQKGKGIDYMQLSVADVALSYDAFKRIPELGVKRGVEHWLFFQDSEGRETMSLEALKSIVDCNHPTSIETFNDLDNYVRYFAWSPETRYVDVYPWEVSENRRRRILKYFDNSPHAAPEKDTGDEIEYYAYQTSTRRQVRLHLDDIAGIMLRFYLDLTRKELPQPDKSMESEPICMRSRRKTTTSQFTPRTGGYHVVHANDAGHPAIYDNVKAYRQKEDPVAGTRSNNKDPAGDCIVTVAQRNGSAQDKPGSHQIDFGSAKPLDIVHGIVLEFSRQTFTTMEIVQELSIQGWENFDTHNVGPKLSYLTCCTHQKIGKNGSNWTHDPKRCPPPRTRPLIHYAVSELGPLRLRDLEKLLGRWSSGILNQLRSISCCKKTGSTYSHIMPCREPQTSIPQNFVGKVENYVKIETQKKPTIPAEVALSISTYKSRGLGYKRISDNLNRDYPDLKTTRGSVYAEHKRLTQPVTTTRKP